MKDTFLSARLVEPNLIRLVIFTSSSFEGLSAVLLIDRRRELPLKSSRVNSTSSVIVADYRLANPLELGHSYVVLVSGYGETPLDISEATSFPGFDEAYFYPGDDLGASYRKEGTSFKIWAPLASNVMLKVKRLGESRSSYYRMERLPRGVWSIFCPGDYARAEYTYLVTNSEVTYNCSDPYAKCSLANGRRSVVADFRSLYRSDRRNALPRLNEPTEAVVYEASVRDLTSDPDTDVVNKGKYKGLSEKGRRSKDGIPVGLDYLTSLGITHLQLLPVYDFQSVDELHPESGYNWGYDPRQYFVPEGSYSTDANNPYARIEELRDLILTLHDAGIRVVMDVVYNHVYEYISSPFEKAVPNYYFRKRPDGRLANCSYCGDDVASERPMVRKLIVDSAKWWIDFYHMDGFRFDLMGIVDATTLSEIASYAKKKDPSFFLHGEGWNMGSQIDGDVGGMMGNYRRLPEFGFFNDSFREAVKHFLVGDEGKRSDVKFSMLGSVNEFAHRSPMFLDARQSTNYVECHDNGTYFDFVSRARGDLSLEERLKICGLAMAFVLLSYGVPFIHMGQEVGLTKFGHENTYNEGDKYNQMSYSVVKEREWLYNLFRSLVALRRGSLAFRPFDPRAIAPLVDILDADGAIFLRVRGESELGINEEVDFFLNPTGHEAHFVFPSPREEIFDGREFIPVGGKEGVEARIPARSAKAYAKRKEHGK